MDSPFDVPAKATTVPPGTFKLVYMEETVEDLETAITAMTSNGGAGALPNAGPNSKEWYEQRLEDYKSQGIPFPSYRMLPEHRLADGVICRDRKPIMTVETILDAAVNHPAYSQHLNNLKALQKKFSATHVVPGRPFFQFMMKGARHKQQTHKLLEDGSRVPVDWDPESVDDDPESVDDEIADGAADHLPSGGSDGESIEPVYGCKILKQETHSWFISFKLINPSTTLKVTCARRKMGLWNVPLWMWNTCVKM